VITISLSNDECHIHSLFASDGNSQFLIAKLTMRMTTILYSQKLDNDRIENIQISNDKFQLLTKEANRKVRYFKNILFISTEILDYYRVTHGLVLKSILLSNFLVPAISYGYLSCYIFCDTGSQITTSFFSSSC
jgi:hypothetical protein